MPLHWYLFFVWGLFCCLSVFFFFFLFNLLFIYLVYLFIFCLFWPECFGYTLMYSIICGFFLWFFFSFFCWFFLLLSGFFFSFFFWPECFGCRLHVKKDLCVFHFVVYLLYVVLFCFGLSVLAAGHTKKRICEYFILVYR